MARAPLLARPRRHNTPARSFSHATAVELQLSRPLSLWRLLVRETRSRTTFELVANTRQTDANIVNSACAVQGKQPTKTLKPRVLT